MQELLVGIIVLAIFIWLGIRVYRAISSGSSCGCASGCSACGKTDCAPSAEQTNADRRQN